jgi:hypothetical protein
MKSWILAEKSVFPPQTLQRWYMYKSPQEMTRNTGISFLFVNTSSELGGDPDPTPQDRVVPYYTTIKTSSSFWDQPKILDIYTLIDVNSLIFTAKIWDTICLPSVLRISTLRFGILYAFHQCFGSVRFFTDPGPLNSFYHSALSRKNSKIVS